MRVRIDFLNGDAFPIPVVDTTDENNYGEIVDIPTELWDRWENHLQESRRWNDLWRMLSAGKD